MKQWQGSETGLSLVEVLGRLEREAFETALGRWRQERGWSDGHAVGIEMKAFRGVHGDQSPGVHPVAASAHQAGVAVGQQAVREKKQVLTCSAPQIMAALGNLTISVIRLAGETNIAAAMRCCAVHASRPSALIGGPLQ